MSPTTSSHGSFPQAASPDGSERPTRTQHRAVVGREVTVVPEASRPTPGPIAVLPTSREIFVRSIQAGGGTVAELSGETRGIVWLSNNPSELVDLLDSNPQIEWVQLPWAGIDAYASVMREFAGRERPLWTSAKGAYAQPVAEHALTLTLALLRALPNRIRATSWAKIPEGRSLYGLSVVIIGAGGIAVELLALLEPFGVDITIVRRSDEPLAGARRTVTVDRLAEVLPDADVVIVAAALTAGTTKLIGEEQFALMKRDAVLINIARGGLVDTDALTRVLAEERLAGAGVDVTDPEPLPDGHPLWSEPRVIVTPHNADTPDMIEPLLAERIRVNVEAFLGDGRFVGVVDSAAGY